MEKDCMYIVNRSLYNVTVKGCVGTAVPSYGVGTLWAPISITTNVLVVLSIRYITNQLIHHTLYLNNTSADLTVN
jgi:hypothetical protein